MVETYENKAAKMTDGAIDHIAIDVKDVDEAYKFVNEAGLNTTRDTIHFLPFWENRRSSQAINREPLFCTVL